MDATMVRDLAVVSRAEAEVLGRVERIYLNTTSCRIAGFSVDVSGRSVIAKQALGAMLGPQETDPAKTGYLRAGDVHALGKDALMVDDRSKLADLEAAPDDEGLVTADELSGRKLVTEDGTRVGEASKIVLDPDNLTLGFIEVSPGFFKGKIAVPAKLVRTIGPDLIVVADEVCRRDANAGDERVEGRVVWETDQDSRDASG